MRMSALERPEAPLARAPFSSSVTRATPAETSANAMLVPMTPPPTTTTSAVSAMVRHPSTRVASLTLRPVGAIRGAGGTTEEGGSYEERVRGNGRRSAKDEAGGFLGGLLGEAVQ